MDRKLFKLFAVVLTLALSLSLSACGSGSSDGSAPAGDEFFVKVATGQQGGTYYPIGIAMAQVFS